MKKRAVTLVLAMVLSLSTVGCGSSAAKKQETNAEVEQEETNAKEQDITEQEFKNDDITIKVEDKTEKYILRELEYEAAEGSITLDKDIPIYCEDGYQIGHINSGATIEITEHGLMSGWFRFQNPIEGTPYDYIYVGTMDIDMDHIYCDSYADTYVSEEPTETETEEPSDPYTEILEAVGYDKNKEYTRDEYIEVLTEIGTEMGKTYNMELVELFINDPMANYDGFHIISSSEITEYTEKTTMNFMNLLDGNSGYDGITEFGITKATMNDGTECLIIVLKIV